MYEKDKHVIIHALYMWKNYIETGNVKIGANDCNNNRDLQKKIKTLDSGQKDFINRLDSLATDILKDKKVLIGELPSDR